MTICNAAGLVNTACLNTFTLCNMVTNNQPSTQSTAVLDFAAVLLLTFRLFVDCQRVVRCLRVPPHLRQVLKPKAAAEQAGIIC
jgi:hypothetical protein